MFLLSVICILSGCKKNHPVTPPPPVDSSQIVDLKRGLLLYLPFSGNFADSSGNHNPTTGLNGAALSSDNHGNANSAFAGTGNGERIMVTNNGSIKFDSAFTLSLNFLEHANTPRQTICSMVKDVDGTGYTFGMSTSTPGIPNLNDGVSYSTTDCSSIGLSPSNLVDDTTSVIPVPDTWYHVVMIFNKGKLQTYVNGTLISEKISATPATRICPDAQVIVGGWWQGDPNTINGKIDEVRIYNRAVNAKEIATLSGTSTSN